MNKIKDRLLLGAVAGIGANIVKNIISRTAMKLGLAEIGMPERAAGILVPSHKITTPGGKVVGHLADHIIAIMLGTATVYTLSVTGKDRPVIKGMLAGQVAWAAFNGVLATMGATRVSPISPKTVLMELFTHTVHGGTAAYLATRLGDPSLFTGKTPLSASRESQTTATTQFEQLHQDRMAALHDHQNKQQQQYH